MHGRRETAHGYLQRTVLHGARGSDGVILHLQARTLHPAIAVLELVDSPPATRFFSQLLWTVRCGHKYLERGLLWAWEVKFLGCSRKSIVSYFRSSHAALGQGASLVEPFLTICFFFLFLLPLLFLPSSLFPSLETITALLLIQVLLKVISFLDRPRRNGTVIAKAHWNSCPCWYQELWRGLVSGVQIWEKGAPEKTLLVQHFGVTWSSNELEWKQQIPVMYIFN